MNFNQHQDHIKMIIDSLDQVGTEKESDYIEFFNRQRILLSMLRYHGNCPVTARKIVSQQSLSQHQPLPNEILPGQSCYTNDDAQKLMQDKRFFILNEVMVSEKDVSQVSLYRLQVDGRDLGKFKSSGIIISTGTGSTGWLYSAKQVSPGQVNHFKRTIGLKRKDEKDLDLMDHEISKIISDKTVFPIDHDQMYYYVREGFQETAISEGFCKDIVLTSDMLSGKFKIDG
mmetsp:Transcript_16355/g.27657  ORF Transcript_16355/g.27657 Transcript_16355/m.27657 type:complete len:229 (-) Transcript_16355:133-819(-)